MNKLGKILAILLIGISIVGCGKKEKEENEAKIEYKNIKVEPAEKKEIDIIATFSGTLKAIKFVDEVTESSGRVIKINHKNGDKVEKGKVIVELENQSIKSRYIDSKAKYESAKSNYLTTKTTYEKFKILYNENLISEEEYNKVKNAYISSQGVLDSNLALLKDAKKNYDDLTMKARFSGVLANLEVEEYERLGNNTRVFSIIDDSELKVYGGIDSKNMLGIKEGAIAKIKVENSNNVVEGKLYEVNPVSDKNTRKFNVKIKMANEDHIYRQGMFAKVELETGKKIGIMVPKKALIVEELSNYIFIVTKENIEVEDGDEKETKEILVAHKIKVNLGSSNGDYQEIISDKLEEKNTVVVEGQYSLDDGDYVKILK